MIEKEKQLELIFNKNNFSLKLNLMFDSCWRKILENIRVKQKNIFDDLTYFYENKKSF